jgi:hypothetical protein
MSSPAKKFRVRDGRVLHFPQEWCEDSSARVWIRSGQVVDLGDPELERLAAGQLYKLEPAEEGEMVWTIDQAPAPLRRHLTTIARQRELEAKAAEEAKVSRPSSRKKKATRRSRSADAGETTERSTRARDFLAALEETRQEGEDASLDSSEG